MPHLYSTISVVSTDSSKSIVEIVEELACADDESLVKRDDLSFFCGESSRIVELADSDNVVVSLTAPSYPAISRKPKARLRQDKRKSDMHTNMVKVPMVGQRSKTFLVTATASSASGPIKI